MADVVRLTIDWREADSNVPEAQQEAFTQTLFQELRSLDQVATVDRIPDPDAPVGGMGAHWLWNILTAEIPGNGLRVAGQAALDQLAGKPLDFTVEVNGQSQKVSASNVRPDDFDRVLDQLVEAAQKMKSAE